MKRDKKITDFAKKLVQLSKDDAGVVTEERVTDVLAGLKQVQPRNYLGILKTYLRYIQRELALQTAVVATPGALSPDALKAIESNFSKLYNRPISAVTTTDASLIAGVRVRVGDDVYDSSVAGRLKRLAEAVH
ncbi:F0F1 ATP synthase subunit delta [Coraliomargarita parva]|uniref:F0F1 ATP synthase subunit delta n=1 Tax=Coraliomargarita parva TaxID=3014050 RepID=UPI0022B39014|nr:F0F1 ATP synthase subunit delta [Coraliomargarita parva]